MTSPVLVTGGTGTLGSLVVPQLRAAGRDVRIVSRHAHAAEPGIEYVVGDLLTGEGLDAALAGVETVVHIAGAAKGDGTVARNLVAAAQRAGGVRHLVHVSVIGVDTVPLAWFRMKLAAEQAIVDSGIPYTVLRPAQFHSLVLLTMEKMTRMPVVPAPGGMRWQPVDPRDVADRLAELALGEPAGLAPDLAGPTVYSMGELARSYLAAQGKHRPLLPLHLPGKVGRAYRDGDNLALGERTTVGHRSWEDYLAEHTRTAA
ncbi:SDR family oxidoreductase [Streptacidiphilus fuscans]|uniref:NAD(P)H-binding protein n=1 Tax=Streptacidiphilus fuscans TaxID=2789292 RepID=A0A931B3K4_9ACTN|nr:NAD(P)H-binding protein [Streptacidiphilus fuscans]MBF9067313.1 NAD(P)H-binding protein [Streptacidiphilus fuscans]